MKLNNIKNGENFIFEGEEYVKLFGGQVTSATNIKTGERINLYGKTNVERPKKLKNILDKNEDYER